MSLPPEPLGDDKEIRALAKILNTVPDLCASAEWTYSLAQLLNARGVRVSVVRAAPREPTDIELETFALRFLRNVPFERTDEHTFATRTTAGVVRELLKTLGVGGEACRRGGGAQMTTCEWTFLRGASCGEPATHRTAGGLLLCATHLTDWARGIWRPCWVVLATGEVFGGVTHGCTVNCE